MKKLNKSSSTPLYMQLKNQLQEKIEQDMSVGDLLLTETEIEKMYHVSRMTVRKAIEELVNEGIVSKQQGKGTFVSQTKTTQGLGRIFSWSEEMKLQHKESKTISVEISAAIPSKKIRTALQLGKHEEVTCIRRVREIDGEPVAIMINYLRAKYVPGLLENGLKSDSLYHNLEEIYHISLVHADEIITARLSTPIESALLAVPEDSAVLHVRRTSYMKGNTPVEVVDMVARGDRYQYLAELEGRTKKHII
ncbi:TPA_asm: UTRA domain-containing protein [Listeria monocytogenes]|uniref:GntR family transcriptional regulator n=1 Tax=Listeria monocytogenes TaxID=1639 RepID=UPI000BDF0376|nr:GntR family transcriptional regulator [Listeria monocytogenes]PCU01023.1 GntR family transcriptional regulator [Listeria monocytogenes]PCV41861.1 GntR family transcriptional regulator [Listeria monocytogenes]HAC5573502.1 UTRA domain-containing protein [Listeria monocytogenes]HCJ3948926.1 GntR family transcriptional regulator [Listeria monocytogenes]